MTEWPKCEWASHQQPEYRTCGVLGHDSKLQTCLSRCLSCSQPADQKRTVAAEKRAAELERVGRKFLQIIQACRLGGFPCPGQWRDCDTCLFDMGARGISCDEINSIVAGAAKLGLDNKEPVK